MPSLTCFERAELEADYTEVRSSLAGVHYAPFWFDDFPRTDALETLDGDTTTDLLVVGGGFAGLWTALRSKERHPDREVILAEAETVGWAASGRNGGFCEPSLTHGRSNAQMHVPHESELLAELGAKNLDELLETLQRYEIDCDVEPHGVIKVATEKHQEASLRDLAQSEEDIELLSGQSLQDQVRTDAASTGVWAQSDGVVLNPGKLVLGLLRTCRRLGVRVVEHTRITGLKDTTDTGPVVAMTDHRAITARRVALATNGFTPLMRGQRLRTVPVYDYAIVTEPLTDSQATSIGWGRRQGLTDVNNRFHYLRKIIDSQGRTRILIGGYDAPYYFGRSIKPEHDVREQTFERLAVHLGVFFPALQGVKISHAWGGMIDTCSRFFSYFSLSHGGKVAYTAGFTGLGVAATRFAGDVMLDLLDGEETERTRTTLVRTKPFPFPPEPLAWPAITFTARQLARSDRRGGKRGLWLSLLDFFKLGFDS